MIDGIDISAAQGTMRWRQLPPEIHFAICKATESTWMDPTFLPNARGAKLAGLVVGSYHVLRPNQDPEAQAKRYYEVAFEDTSMPPALDFELLKGVSPEDAVARAEDFVFAVEALWKKPCTVYTYPHFWRSLLGDPDSHILGTRPLWIANYQVQKPYVPRVWAGTWTIWQWDGDGGKKLPWGTDADFNRFNGDADAFHAYCEASAWEASPTDVG